MHVLPPRSLPSSRCCNWPVPRAACRLPSVRQPLSPCGRVGLPVLLPPCLPGLGLAHRELEPVCSNQGCPPDPRNGHDQLLIPAVHSPVFAAGASCDSKST